MWSGVEGVSGAIDYVWKLGALARDMESTLQPCSSLDIIRGVGEWGAESLPPASAPPPGAPHTCGDCGKSFTKQDRLKRHQSMHSEDHKRFECVECKKSFKWERSLSQHVKIHSQDNPFVCMMCNKSFSKRCHVESHLRTHIDDHKRFTCSECGKAFKWEKSLKQHCRSHAHALPHRCAHCAKCFLNHKSYAQHVKVHSVNNPFSCSHCGKVFSKRSHLDGHLKIHDADKRLYECSVCEKTFKWEKSLTAHKLLHSGEAPYRCHFCNKTFTRSDSLKKHVRTHSLKYLHALPFGPNTSEEQVLHLMQKVHNSHFEIEKYMSKNEDFASFKIGIPPVYFDAFMQPNVWPDNMCVKEWKLDYHTMLQK